MQDSGATDVLAALPGITAFAVLFVLPIVVTALKANSACSPSVCSSTPSGGSV
ncbi:hypothetical protein [Nocardia sp. NPDC049526]|uniref:hypothetical protein n=1 Tax=Nocardia sp. NPDC049526 TaxID=3364316 RepID=UPI0037B2F558